MNLIDTHCHLNFPDLFLDPAGAIEEAVEAGVQRMIAVGCDEPTSRRAVELASEYEAVFATVGIHPNSSSTFQNSDLGWIEELAEYPKTVAIGEIGLDFHWDYASPAEQAHALEAQFELARSLGLPIVLHCRKAYPALLEFLEARACHPVLFHCFSGSDEDAERAERLGGWFGFDGPITYKNSTATRAQAARLPRDRIVVETDSPYLTPEPFRGRPNRPAYVAWVNAALAAVWGCSPEESAAITTANAERFFAKLA